MLTDGVTLDRLHHYYVLSVWEKGRGSTNQEAQLWIFNIDVILMLYFEF